MSHRPRTTGALRAGRAAPTRLYVALAACALLAGCDIGGGADEKPVPEPVVRTAERGPVKVTVTCDKKTVTIAETLHVTIAAEAPAGVEVTLPDFGENLGQFQIRDFIDQPPQAQTETRRWEQRYDLDTFLSGEYVIPAMTVRFVDARKRESDPGAEPIEGEIETEPIPVEVTSLLEGEFDPTQFRDIKGPVALPAEPTQFWLKLGIAAAGGLLVLVLIIWAICRWRRRPARRRVMAPHDWAFDQLRHLIDDQLVEQGFVQEFFYRLSEITRVYIELRFGLMAAEQTTEEFLRDTQSSGVLSDGHKRRLAEFLQACDLVKFARYEPGVGEIERAFHSARDFVEETRPVGRPEEDGVPTAGPREVAA